jgi:hypothetical protein
VIPKLVFPKFLVILSILGVSVVAGAQTLATKGASLPPRGSEKYWLVVDEFADGAIHFAYAKRFVQLHERSLSGLQCQQYSQIALDFADQLAAVRRAGVSAENEFWDDVRVFSNSMIGTPGAPNPVHRSTNYWVTTGAEAEDRELRRLVSLEIDDVSSQMTLTDGYSSLALKPGCLPADPEPTIKAER